MKRNIFPIPDTPYIIAHMDDLNWTVQETRVVQKGDNAGKETIVTRSYHATLGQALRAVAFLITDAEIVADIESYIDRLNAVEHRLREVVA